MGRIDRIGRLEALLREADATSAPALAEALGVSARTVLRDLALLRERGLPIVGEAGRGGGVRLLRDRGATAVHLSLEEIASLWLAASLARRGTALPWGGAARGALGKLLQSIPAERARELRAVLRRVVLAAPASPAVAAGAGGAAPELLSCVERALRRGVALGFAYRDREGKVTERRAEPHGLLVQPPVWYILAVDVDKGEPRTFRMDRIARPRLLDGCRFLPSAAVIAALTEGIPQAERSG